MSFKIVLAREVAQTETGSGFRRLKMWVKEYEDVDPNIFVYQRTPNLVGQTNDADVFQHPASYADMQEYPVGAPAPGVIPDPPFFRLSFVDIVFRSNTDMEAGSKKIEERVKALISAYKNAENFKQAEDIIFE